MYVSSYKAVNLNAHSPDNRSDHNAAAADQNKELSNYDSAKKKLDIEPIMNTDKYFNAGKNSDSISVFDQLLTHAYRKLNEQFALSPETEAKMSEVNGYNDGQPVTAEKASNNILGFIERRIMLDKADGASQAQLESRLAAGLEGFEKGFAQAKEQLEALSLLSPAITADIQKTYDFMRSGIDTLKEKYLGAPAKLVSEDSLNEALKEFSGNPSAQGAEQYLVSRELESKSNNSEPVLAVPVLDSSFNTSNNILAQRNSFNFDLKTLGGDTVSISAAAQELNVSKYGYEHNASFALQIVGELDEGELKAINELLFQVNELAGTFYAGDIGKAFEQALNVGYNSEEIAQFALTLTHSEVQKIQSSYQENAPETLLAQRFQPISHFVEQVIAAIDNANYFGNPIDLIQQLVSQLETFRVGEDGSGNRDDSSPVIEQVSQKDIGGAVTDKSAIKFIDFVNITIRLSSERAL